MSRVLLLLGAPLCFIIQARPVKLFMAECMYILLKDPPAFILSLLPAPQQVMLNLSDKECMKLIYGEDEYKAFMDENDAEDDDDDVDVVEEEEEEGEEDEEEEEDSDEDTEEEEDSDED